MTKKTKKTPARKARRAPSMNGRPRARATRPAPPAASGGPPAGQDLEAVLQEITGAGKEPEEGKGRLGSRWDQIQCPYCGESFDVHLDSVEDGHVLQEDCHVCCKPVQIAVHVEEEEVLVTAQRC